MWGSNSRHGGALLELHTGSDTFVRPSMGSWITYGLGSENQNLPGYVTICPTLSHGGANNYGSAFLPAPYAGTPIGSGGSRRGCEAAVHYEYRHAENFNAWSSTLRRMNRRTPADRSRLRAGRPHRLVRAGFPDASGAPELQEVAGNRRPRRSCTAWTSRHGGLRPPVPDGATVVGAGRALRASEPYATNGISTRTFCATMHRTRRRSISRLPACLPTSRHVAFWRHAGRLGR